MEKKELGIAKYLRATGSCANNQNFQSPCFSKDSLKKRYRTKLQSNHEKCVTEFFLTWTFCITRK